MDEIYHQIVENMRRLMARILEPKLDLDKFLDIVTRSAKELDPDNLEARVYEVDFIENTLTLKTSTQTDVDGLSDDEKNFVIKPKTITGDSIIENRCVVGSRVFGYAESRFFEGQDMRAAFPIEFYDVDLPEGRTKYVLVVDKMGEGGLRQDVVAALQDYSILAGLAISIKELRDTLSQFYETNRNLVLTGRHSAAIGHDIRSLNVGVGGYLTMAFKMISDIHDNEKVQKASEYLTMARNNARQVESLLSNFTQFNRRSIILNRDTDLAVAVKDKIESLQNRLDIGRNLEIDLAMPDAPTNIMVDADWFGTVVENIVRNSVEACGGLTKLYVKLVVEPDSGVKLVFEDECGGIPSEILRDIFTPFKSNKKKGQGLGLANAKKVIDDHGAGIFVTSRAGHGAVFTIEFPPPE